MPQLDMPLEDLVRYCPDLPAPKDLLGFWRDTLARARAAGTDPLFTPIDTGLTLVTTEDVTFTGFDGQPVRGWLHRPAGVPGPLPAVVEYLGYGGGRGLPHQPSLWANAGYAHLIMDTRGQGSLWQPGDTADPDDGGPAAPGFASRGIARPDTYYYRRVFTDAVRAVDAVRAHPNIDPKRVAVSGGSQGGGIALAVSGLVCDLWAVMPDVPFLCNFPRAITFGGREPYLEIVRYLTTHRDATADVYRTLSYHDAAILCRWANAPALFSVGLMDPTCPPSTVYTAFNAYGLSVGGELAEMVVYPFNEHEGGAMFQDRRKLAWLGQLAERNIAA